MNIIKNIGIFLAMSVILGYPTSWLIHFVETGVFAWFPGWTILGSCACAFMALVVMACISISSSGDTYRNMREGLTHQEIENICGKKSAEFMKKATEESPIYMIFVYG